MRPIGVIPSSIPIDQAGNLVDPVWYLFFQQLYVRSGGAISQSNNELIVGQLDDAGIEESRAEIYALRDQISSMYSAVQALLEDLNNAPVQQQGYDFNPASVQIAGGNIDGTIIGGAVPASGNFTDLTSGQAAQIINTSVAPTNYSAAGVATFTNAPHAGNPDIWFGVNLNGTIYKVGGFL